MAHIPQGDITELWNESGHNWHALHQTLEQHRGKKDGISDNLIDMMIKISKEMEQSGQSFPDSPQKLYEVLNEKIGATSH